MAGLSIFLFLWALTYVLNKSGVSNSSGVHANRAPLIAHYFCVYVFWQFVFLFVYIFLNESGLPIEESTKKKLNGIVYLLVFLPSIGAYICIRKGWVKPSLSFGRMAFIANARDMQGGAYFWAWRALQRAPNEVYDKKLALLNTQLDRTPNKKISTAVLLSACFIKHPESSAIDIAEKLQHFGNCANKRIPKHVASYCFRFCLAAELSAVNISAWEGKIAQVTDSWHGKRLYWSTNWIRAKLAKRQAKTSPYQRIILMLGIGRTRWAHQIFSLLPEVTAPINEIEDPSQFDIKHLYRTNINDSQVQQLQNFSVSDEFEQRWRKRAAELGCFDPDLAIADIQQSITDYAGINSAAFRDQSDLVHEHISKLQRQLSIQINSLKARSRPSNENSKTNKHLNVFNELEKWLDILDILKKLDQLEPGTRISLYYKVRDECWNWMADLWNTGNHSLAYFICKTLNSLAIVADDTEAKKTFTKVLKGKCS